MASGLAGECSAAWPGFRKGARTDDGQLLLLLLGYVVIAALLVTVVVDVSIAYLHRRALVAAADGAAVSAANQPDLAEVYSGGGWDALPLSDRGATEAVHRYAEAAGLRERFDGFEVLDVTTDGQTVTVTLRAVAHLPLANLVVARYRNGYPVVATASARSPLSP